MSGTAYKPPRVQPLVALSALCTLLRNPQDTRQVALLTAALRGRSGVQQYNKFKASPVGARTLTEKRRLADILDNHAYLATLPETSLGRRYLTFMAEENLSAKGLKEVTAEANIQNASDEVQIFTDRTRDLHDLYHVLAGYGRDEIGELCVLAFSYPQQRLRSYAVLAFFGALKFARQFDQQNLGAAGVLKAVRQAYQHGKAAAWLPGEDIESMLAQDIEVLRRRLNIAPPDKYLSMISTLRAKTTWRNGPIFSRPDHQPITAPL